MPKTLKNFRLSDVAIEILARESRALGVSEAAWVETQIREGDNSLSARKQRSDLAVDSMLHPRELLNDPLLEALADDPTDLEEAEKNSLGPEVSAQRKAKRKTKAKGRSALRLSVKSALKTKPRKCGRYCESHGNYCDKEPGHEGRCNHKTESLAPHRFRKAITAPPIKAQPDHVRPEAAKPCPIHSPKRCPSEPCKYK